MGAIDQATGNKLTTDQHSDEFKKHNNNYYKRSAGIRKAVDKLTKEDVQIDELSKGTLASYIKKSGRAAANYDDSAEFMDNLSKRASTPKLHNDAMDRATYNRQKSNKRLGGIVKASAKLAKEELGVSNDE
jgi:hypothetical protein